MQMASDIRRSCSVEGIPFVVLVVCSGEVWQQVHSFISGLNGPYVPICMNVVILAPTLPRPGYFDDLEAVKVATFDGSCLSAASLCDAGITEARAVVVMSGETPPKRYLHSVGYIDYKTILCSQELEYWCSTSEREVFTIYELQDNLSARLLPGVHINAQHPRNSAYHELMSEKSTTSSPDVRDLAGQFTTNFVAFTDTVEVDETEDPIMFHPRFAAGQVFPPQLWGAMLGRMYYMPVLIELVEALVLPHRREQSSFSWQISVPPRYVGKKFGQFFSDCVNGFWCTEGFAGNCKNGLADDAIQQGAEEQGLAVPLAVYRTRHDVGFAGIDPRDSDSFGSCEQTQPSAYGTGGHHYSVLGPDKAIVLHLSDWILVLGSHAFGNRMLHTGLLRDALPLRNVGDASTE